MMEKTPINDLVKGTNKELSSIYKKKISQELASVSLTQEKRDNINALVSEALDNMMPQEKVEETKVEDSNVLCKLLLKAYPQSLMNTVEQILRSVTVKKQNGSTDYEKTKQYVMTFMLEEVKEPKTFG